MTPEHKAEIRARCEAIRVEPDSHARRDLYLRSHTDACDLLAENERLEAEVARLEERRESDLKHIDWLEHRVDGLEHCCECDEWKWDSDGDYDGTDPTNWYCDECRAKGLPE